MFHPHEAFLLPGDGPSFHGRGPPCCTVFSEGPKRRIWLVSHPNPPYIRLIVMVNSGKKGHKPTTMGIWWLYTGWWFGTWFLWLSIQLGISSSQLTSIFFRGVGIPPTRWTCTATTIIGLAPQHWGLTLIFWPWIHGHFSEKPWAL